jgi:protein TonB
MAHHDILEKPESLRSPFVGSLVFHVMFLSLLAFYTLVGNRNRETWGSPMVLGGGTVEITTVKTIPLPAHTGPTNPVANDSKSSVPLPPKNVAKPAPKPVENAIPIKARNNPKPRQAEKVASSQQFRPDKWKESNKLTSSVGGALSSKMFGGANGSGMVGIGAGILGNRFGYYTDLLQRRVAEKWNTAGLPQTAPPVVVTFDILRSGQTKSIRVEQSSGNPALDNTALRAIYEASPFDPLPGAYPGNDVNVELWFYLKR